jgi:catechol 2,3-dioxygenase-like lactoylglutathione lyase family enzyme
VFGEGDTDPGNTIFTHPKDTFGQIEFEGRNEHWMGLDPRFKPDWSTQPWKEGPLGIERLSYMTTVVRDLEAARRFYERTLDGMVFHHESSATATSAFVVVGLDTVVELAQPIDERSRLAADLAAHGELPHAVTLLVRDLENAERRVEKVGVRVVDRSGDALSLDPRDCFGALWRFTDRRLPGDPRDQR